MATQNISPVTPSAATRNSSHPANELRWQTGQTLHAKVMQDSGTEKFLRIGRNDFAARGLTSLSPGQSLKLEVIRMGETPILKLLQESPTAKAMQTQRLLDIPRQNSFLALTSLLSQTAGAGSKAVIPDTLNNLLNKLPNIEQVFTSDNLKQLIRQSGLFLENHLSQPLQTGNVAQDLKTVLLLFSSELRRSLGKEPSRSSRNSFINAAPPDRNASPRATVISSSANPLSLQTEDLLDAIESVLARQRLNQIESLPNKLDNSRVWLLEIPVIKDDKPELLQLRIEQENRNVPSEQQTWTVEIAVAPDNFGPIHAKLTLVNQAVSISLWINENNSISYFQNAIELLSSRLSHAGLNIKRIQIFKGMPPEQPSQQAEAILEQKA